MRLKCYLLLILVTVFFSGCGGGADNPVSNANEASKLAVSQTCMNLSCHGGMVNPVTGGLIAQEWLASTHNTKNGAGCADCHEPDAGHPNLCYKCHGGGGFGVTVNPDQAGKCGKCHGLNHPQDVMVQLAPQHFGNLTTSSLNNTYRASYVSSNYLGNCRKCHNPHDTSSAHQVNADWAASAHGNVLDTPRTRLDFKTFGTYQPVALTYQYFCVRCHTTTGYIDFVSSNFTDQRPFAGPGFPVIQNMPGKALAPSPDKSKEVTGCDACHDDGKGNAYGFQVRAVPAASIYYNFSSASSSPTVKLNTRVVYPDLGNSNVCMPCHSGRGLGGMITAAQSQGMNFSNTNAPNGHNLAIALVLFQNQRGGYEFPGSGRSYETTGFNHDQVGTANLNGTGTGGPCVSCHMQNGSRSHTFLPVATDAAGNVTAIVNQSCALCHNGADAPEIGIDQYRAEKAGYQAALSVLDTLFAGKVLNKNRNYDAFSPGGGAYTMGVAFNDDLLDNEPGAFAHNPLYTKRLLYDSIDWIDDHSLDDSVVATINNLLSSGAITADVASKAVTYLTTAFDGTPYNGRPNR